LSLVKDYERRKWMNSIKSKIGLDFEFFDAFTPNRLTPNIKSFFKATDFHEWDINEEAVMATFISHVILLKIAARTNENVLILEDDIDIVKQIDWNEIDFDFDLWNLTGKDVACFAYMVTPEGAKKILHYLNTHTVTQAYDWELSKLPIEFKIKKEAEPIFMQVEHRFISNIAPNGYERR
jgi:GR25 family glycosyltransferase involved in LPS biosynthesis